MSCPSLSSDPDLAISDAASSGPTADHTGWNLGWSVGRRFLTSYQVGIPFIVGGNAILGGLVGYLTLKGFRPLVASIVALAVELPYVAATDLLYLQWPIVQIVLLMLAAETLISADLAELIVRSTAVKSLASGLRS